MQGPMANVCHHLGLTHQDYSVGWICALPKEQTAAIAMLDNKHPYLSKLPHDQNAYTLGCIGNHNVVIACLPKGQYATIPAAKVATWMIGTFPSIRFGLMVGIGGGIPPEVRLGDVVVSTPSAEFSGVIQWDLGKAEDHGHFKRTGSLNNPPTALLTALATLESQHAMNGSKTGQYLDEMAKRYPRLKLQFTSTESLSDPLLRLESSNSARDGWYAVFVLLWQMIKTGVLYLLGILLLKPIYHQLEPATNENAAAMVEKDKKNTKEPRVHYGLIASGNQVIKDAKFRDRLNQSLGGKILCVEMEAAGLMNDFPCIVIRGICDYADGSKNKDWQEYAAAVAACYAKELLEIVISDEVKATPEARLVTQTRQ